MIYNFSIWLILWACVIGSNRRQLATVNFEMWNNRMQAGPKVASKLQLRILKAASIPNPKKIAEQPAAALLSQKESGYDNNTASHSFSISQNGY